jgi:hypothetical protein
MASGRVPIIIVIFRIYQDSLGVRSFPGSVWEAVKKFATGSFPGRDKTTVHQLSL